jgi:hypothetical protein
MTAPDELLKEYLSKGRKLEDADVATLNDMWRAVAKKGAGLASTDMVGRRAVLEVLYSIEAELSLRGLEPPAPRDKKDLH